MSYYENLISDQIDAGLYHQEQYYKSLDMINRITTEPILTLQHNEIAVVGTNEGGRHRKGFALYCFENFGAILGQGFGLQGRCFGIPTKDNSRPLQTLSVSKITPYVDRFIDFAESRQDLIFKVSKVGCGLAGYEPEEIAPLFKRAVPLKNIHLPREFWDILNNIK